jgi:prophage DNA circulation protein
MNKVEIVEAVPLIRRLCSNLIAAVDPSSAMGIQARIAIGAVVAYADRLCAADTIGPALDNCFDLVRQAGCSLIQMEEIRVLTSAEKTKTLGATLVRDFSIQLALAQEAKIISAMIFVSRQDVDGIIAVIPRAFNDAEETAADTMDAMVYRALISLRAALVNHLVQTARPLPTMIAYQFTASLPSIVISYRLYGDASRYDQIRAENKVVHPAFCPPLGLALSA